MWLKGIAAIEPGDVLFYKGGTDPVSVAIEKDTHSDITHCGICVEGGSETSAGTMISAESGGVTLSTLGSPLRIWSPTPAFEMQRLVIAIDWLHQQVGQPYGFTDIINQFLIRFGRDAILLDQHADCSDLCARFLWIAGAALPASCINTEKVTPASLADALDALP